MKQYNKETEGRETQNIEGRGKLSEGNTTHEKDEDNALTGG